MTLIEALSRNIIAPRHGGLLSELRMRLDLWRSRRALARLDAALLQDIGVDEAAARREARLGVWNAPENWINR